jgi:hypothetical protein
MDIYCVNLLKTEFSTISVASNTLSHTHCHAKNVPGFRDAAVMDVHEVLKGQKFRDECFERFGFDGSSDEACTAGCFLISFDVMLEVLGYNTYRSSRALDWAPNWPSFGHLLPHSRSVQSFCWKPTQ